MNTTQPRIRTVGDKWPRFVIVRETPEPGKQREYWDGEKWVRKLRSALLYAHTKFVRRDLKKVRGQD
jgi:hypothetical protein